MYIKKIEIKNLRKFSEHTMTFETGFQEIKQNNEWGKTTLVDAIRYALTDKKMSLSDQPAHTSQDPEIIVHINDNSKNKQIELQFKARGLGLKPKKEREKIAEYFGTDYNFLLNKLLIVKHNDIADFKIDKKYLESIIQTHSISQLSQKIENLFKQNNELKSPGSRPFEELNQAIQQKKKLLLELEKKLKDNQTNRQEWETLTHKETEIKESLIKKNKEKELIRLLILIKEWEDYSQKKETLDQNIKLSIDESEKWQNEINEIESQLKLLKTQLSTIPTIDLGNLNQQKGKWEAAIEQMTINLKKCESINQQIIFNQIKIRFSDTETLKQDKKFWEQAQVRLAAVNKIGLRAEIADESEFFANGEKLISHQNMEFNNKIEIILDDKKTLYVWSGGKEASGDREKIEEFSNKYHSIETIEEQLNWHEHNQKLAKEKIALLNKLSEMDYKQKLNDTIKQLSDIKEKITQATTQETERKRVTDEFQSLEKRKIQSQEKYKAEQEKIRLYKQELQNLAQIHGESLSEAQNKIDELPSGVVRKYQEKDIQELLNRQKEVSAEIDNHNATLLTIVRRMGDIKSAITDLSENQIDILREEIQSLLLKRRKSEHYIKILKGLKIILPQLQKELEKNIMEKILKRASEYFSFITENKYQQIVIEEENFQTMHSQGIFLDHSFLSDGTHDQLFFALRFALIHEFSNQPKFIILDEPFAHTDNERETQIRNILQKFSQNGWQILLFSCKV